MQLVIAKTKKQLNRFKTFRKKLYHNDPYYVSTVEFTCDMLLYQTTSFAKTCQIEVVMVEEKTILCEALLIKAPLDDFVQIAFFEALENVDDAVEMLVNYAKEFAKTFNVSKIIVGLNGHLSYGVGLSIDMKEANTFDSTYTKLYYQSYFKEYIKHELVAFANKPSEVFSELVDRKSNIQIRTMNLKKFDEEMEIFRQICNETIGTTYLYQKTSQKHFSELMEDMKFFLRNENILFACHEGKVIGFVFWHPDYNEILKKGKHNSLISIAIRYLLFKNKIKKVKLNSIGVKEEYQGIATIALLKELGKRVLKFEKIETNFVWKNNKKSMAINKRLLKEECRKFVVYEVNV